MTCAYNLLLAPHMGWRTAQMHTAPVMLIGGPAPLAALSATDSLLILLTVSILASFVSPPAAPLMGLLLVFRTNGSYARFTVGGPP